MSTLKKQSLFMLFLFFTGIRAADSAGWPKKMAVTAPVANLRHEPSEKTSADDSRFDWNQTTQLLYGDRVIGFERKGGYLRVAAIEQKIHVNNRWHYCTGWIKENFAQEVPKFPERNLVVKKPWARIKVGRRKKSLSIGTRLVGSRLVGSNWEVVLHGGKKGYVAASSVNLITNKNMLRDKIVRYAKKFIGSPYFLGGRSFACVDCSGLVGLCYQVAGKKLPKNARSQYKKCKKISFNPKPGDLIFISHKKSPESISHVMLYAGNDSLIEARWGDVKKVRMVSLKERFGKSIHEIKSGDKIGEVYVFFGTFLAPL